VIHQYQQYRERAQQPFISPSGHMIDGAANDMMMMNNHRPMGVMHHHRPRMMPMMDGRPPMIRMMRPVMHRPMMRPRGVLLLFVCFGNCFSAPVNAQ
jgi:hypothetical protein